MRASSHNGRTNKKGATYRAKHNDRTNEAKNAKHIDQAKTKDNVVIKAFEIEKSETNLEEYEVGLYKRFFSASQEAKNKRYREQGHREKCKPVESLYRSKKTAPEETIKQVGKKGDTITAEQLKDVALDYMSEFNKRYGSNVLILDASIHLDEATPHVHFRRVFVGKDKDGYLKPSEAEAFRELGIEAPRPDEKINRYNNAKMTFTEQDRQLFIEICEQHGLNIDKEPIKGKKALELNEYRLEAKKEELSELNKEISYKKDTLKEIVKKIRLNQERDKFIEVSNYLKREEPEVFNALLEEVEAELELDGGDGIQRKANIEI